MLNLIVFSIYFLLSVILTYPLITHLATFVTNPIDPLLYVWNLDHNYQSAIHGFKNLVDTNMFFPETNTLSYSDHLFGQTIILFPLFLVLARPLVIQNIYIFSTFVFAAFGTFLLVYYLTKNRKAAFISGLIFTFSLYHFDHLGQVPTTSIQWIPFSVLYLFKSFDKPAGKNFILFLTFFTLNFLSTIYYGIFLSLAVFLFVLMRIKKDYRTVGKLVLYSFPFLLIICLSLYPYILFHLENLTIKRTLEEASWRSANISDFFTKSGFIHDRALFSGYVAILLTAVAIFFLKKTFAKTYFFLVLLSAAVLALGPEKWGIKLPYYYLYKIFPPMQSIRVPSRIGILSIFSFAVISGLMLANLDKVKVGKNIKNLVFLLITILTIAEFANIPVKFTQVPTLEKAPPVYYWLAKQPENIVVLELPLRSGRNSNHIEDQVNKNYPNISAYDNFIAETFRLYFSIIHRKKMINGYSSYFPPAYSEAANVMENFPSQESIPLIKRRKVDYVIVHTRQYAQKWEKIKSQLSQETDLKIVQDFGDDVVYSL